MSEIQTIIDELKSIHDGDPWHGPSLKEILSGVTAEQAAPKPLTNAHSIWELTLHIAAIPGAPGRYRSLYRTGAHSHLAPAGHDSVEVFPPMAQDQFDLLLG